jgi:hypothetical protein
MGNLATYHLRFTVQVVTPLMLDEHCGSALRGNLFQAVWEGFCTNKAAASCADCPLHNVCAVSTLVAPLRDEHTRGRDIPRPYIILPPLSLTRRYEPGETFQFGITLFGSIIQLLPYLMLSVNRLEAVGLGQRLSDNRSQRGRFRIMTIENYNPISGERCNLYERGQQLFHVPTIAVTEQDICKRAEQLPDDRVMLTFLTPTRIIEREHLAQRASFGPLIHRLLERLTALESAYGDGASITQEEIWSLAEQAQHITCSEDRTHWADVKSHSNRQKRFVPIGGFVGQATFTGNLVPFHKYLVWGELVHVGKSCVKGDGWYSLDM